VGAPGAPEEELAVCATSGCMMRNGWTRDEWLHQQRAMVDQYGWSVIAVPGERGQPSLAYTVGLSRWGHPELLVSALGAHDAARVLNAVGDLVRTGRRLSAGEIVEVPGWHPLQLLAVRDPGCMVVAHEILGSPDAPVSGLQVAWADHDGRWPWDRAVRWRRGTQRLYGDVPGDGEVR
jgi:hypothetical protein